jgi:hypothetical protein
MTAEDGLPGEERHMSQTQRSKADVLAIMKRLGLDDDLIADAARILPDPVDLDLDQRVLARFGLSRGGLIDRMGGSP